jgi:hypothetical protein
MVYQSIRSIYRQNRLINRYSDRFIVLTSNKFGNQIMDWFSSGFVKYHAHQKTCAERFRIDMDKVLFGYSRGEEDQEGVN